MIKPEFFILDVLQGKLTDTEGNPVRLIQNPPAYNNMPTLTIDTSASNAVLESNKTNITINGERQEVIETVYEADLRIDIWCLDEDTRETLIDQVMLCFNRALSDYYHYCSNYCDGECSTLNNSCLVDLPEYAYDKRAIKKQCPKPKDLSYENLFTKYDIDLYTFSITPPYNLDDLEETEAILRTRFNISFDWTDYYIIGGIVSESLSNNIEE